ncbi:hypothetical protein [Rheinheimera sp.]|uniref:hypothetical protein n=1 Tax=Rheinheimera sp. TaxID=1869214 RepID=UPI00307E917F
MEFDSTKPVRNGNDEKLVLEHQAARYFMRAYQRRFAVKMQHIWHNEPSKPDVSCYLAGQKLDLEIAHLYGSEAEAMQFLGRALSPATLHELALLQQTEVADRLLTALRRLIRSKANKSYDSARVWLVIRNTHPDWQADELTFCPAKVTVPAGHPFEQIWLLPDLTAESGLVRLWPQ